MEAVERPWSLTVDAASVVVDFTDCTACWAGLFMSWPIWAVTSAPSCASGCPYSLGWVSTALDASWVSFSVAGSGAWTSQPAPNAISPAASGFPGLLLHRDRGIRCRVGDGFTGGGSPPAHTQRGSTTVVEWDTAAATSKDEHPAAISSCPT